MNEVKLRRAAQHAAFDAENSSLLSAPSQQLCQKAVEDIECCMPWPGLCRSSNVSIYLGQHIHVYGHVYIYTENEVKISRATQHAAFDAANSSLLSANSE